MSKEIHLTVEQFSDGEESKYLLSSPKEILHILNSIVQKKTNTLLYCNNEEHFFKTLVLAVNDKEIWLDAGPSAEDNKLLGQSDHITLVTTHLGAKVQFVCRQVEISTYSSLPAIRCPMPQQILRLQRRDFYRLPTSIDSPLVCIIPPLESADTPAVPDAVSIMNISEGGLALVCKQHNVKLTEGEIYQGCKIDLPGIGTLLASIQVQNLFEVTSPIGVVTKHAGCKFVKLDGKMSMLLQRYVGTMQSKLSKLV